MIRLINAEKKLTGKTSLRTGEKGKSMLNSIVTERKMSLNHWRYRVLHWYFGVTEEGYGSNVPRYFYTHYCPLFHFTNLVVLFLPIIVMWRVMKYVVTHAIFPLFDAIAESFRKAKQNRASSTSTPTKPQFSFLFVLKKYSDNGTDTKVDFDVFFEFAHCYGFDRQDKETYKAKFDVLYPQLVAAAERRKARALKMKERVQFWVRFSSVFIKWGLYATYAALAASLVWFFATCGGTGISWFWYLMTAVDWLWVGRASLGFLLAGTFMIATVYIQKRFKVFNLFFEGVGFVTSPILSPVGHAIVATGTGISNGLSAIGEFIAVFFEENCPPITIVSEEEEEIEKE